LFYAENLRRLGCLDYAQTAALDWQTREDIEHLEALGLRVVGEVDVRPTPDRLQWTSGQGRKFGMDGVYVGVLEPLSSAGTPTDFGTLCADLIKGYRPAPLARP
jgi:hypothetical protein